MSAVIAYTATDEIIIEVQQAVRKCPNLSEETKDKIIYEIKRVAKSKILKKVKEVYSHGKEGDP